LAQSMKIRAKNAVSFFAYKAKILANLIMKGLKGKDEFTPIIHWFETILNYKEKIVTMINTDATHTTMHLFLGVIKPGLVSKSYEVAALSVKIFTKMSLLFHEKFLLDWAYEWFVSDDGALQTSVHAIKRHADLKPKIFKMFKLIAIEDNFVNLLQKFREKFNKNEEFYPFLHEVLTPMLVDNEIICEIKKSNLDSKWIEKISNDLLKQVEYDAGVYYGICFIVDWWEFKGEEFDRCHSCSNEELLGAITHYIVDIEKSKKYFGHKTKSASELCPIPNANGKISFITQLFRLYDVLCAHEEFSGLKKRLFTTFFEIIFIYGLCETIRDFVCYQLNDYLKTQELELTNEIAIYLKFMKRYSTANKSLNFIDLQFLQNMIVYSTIPVKYSAPLFDSLTAIFFMNINTASVISDLMAILASRYISENKIKQYCVMLAKISLNKYLGLEKKRRKPLGYFEGFYIDGESNVSKEVTNEMVNLQKKALIIKFLNEIIQIEDPSVNKNMKWLIIYTNLLYKNHLKDKNLGLRSMPNNKGMMFLLNYYGDPEKLIAQNEIEAEFKIVTGAVASLEDVFKELDIAPQVEYCTSIHAKNLNLHYMKSQMSKERMYQLAMKRGVKADPR
jgi:hypothetical protein